MKKSLISLLLFVGAYSAAYAQEAAVAAGGDATGSTGSASFSIGEVVYAPINTAAYSVTQGVQQPFSNVTTPVTKLQLSCTNRSNTVLLKWQTETEVNSNFFLIERSHNGEKFEPIGRDAAAGSSTTAKHYGFEDRLPFAGTNYYRIKEVDIDGRFMYSNIVQATTNNLISAVYPNPTYGSVTLQTNSLNGWLVYTVTDPTGKLLKTGVISGANTIMNLKTLPAATYVLTITDTNNKLIEVFKVIKK